MAPLAPHTMGGNRIQDAGALDSALRIPGPERRRAKTFNLKTARVSYLEYRHTVRGRSYRYFVLTYFDNGRRRRETRSTFAAAKARAEQIDQHVRNGEINMLSLKEADRAAYQEACTVLAPTKKTLVLATSSYADMHRRAPDGWTVERIFETGLANLPTKFAPKNVPELVQDFLSDRKAQVGSKYYRVIEQQLELFAEHFTGPLHETNSASLNTWLRSLDVGPYTRKHYRAALNQLIIWSKANGYMPRTWSEMDHVARPEPKPTQTRILTPEQLTRLLESRQNSEAKRYARKTLIPFIVLTAFAGIRHEEMNGEKALLDWRDINLKERRIYVPKDVAKVGNDRIVPVSDNLAEWLKPYARANGPVVTIEATCNALCEAKRRAGIPAGKNETRNTLRKSFISYRLALVKNIAQVAEEAGNSPAKIRSNYNRPIPEAEGRRWFEIFPKQAQLRFKGL